jgi:DNA-binding NarL/FixJ family response regulator
MKLANQTNQHYPYDILMFLERIVDLVKELQMTEAAMSLSERKNLIPKEKTQAEQTNTKENGAEAKEIQEKPAISKRNKEILKLIEMGRGIEEIAEELNLKPETVAVELEYLLKAGMIKAKPT